MFVDNCPRTTVYKMSGYLDTLYFDIYNSDIYNSDMNQKEMIFDKNP